MFSKHLELLRKSKKLTQEELGKILGFRDSTISQYETGKREPDFETLKRIADFFEVTTDYLLGKDEPPNSFIDSIPIIDDLDISDITDEEARDVQFIRHASKKMTNKERRTMLQLAKVFIKSIQREGDQD